MTTEDPRKVKLGDVEVELQRPRSHALRHDIAQASLQNPQRALMAALGACWPKRSALPGERYLDAEGRPRRRPRPSYEACSYNVGAYGGQVMDFLMEHGGVSLPELTAAGAVAFGLISDGLYGEQEVKSAEDFSGQPEEA